MFTPIPHNIFTFVGNTHGEEKQDGVLKQDRYRAHVTIVEFEIIDLKFTLSGVMSSIYRFGWVPVGCYRL